MYNDNCETDDTFVRDTYWLASRDSYNAVDPYYGQFRVRLKVQDDDGDWSQWSDETDWYEFWVTRPPRSSVSGATYREINEGENISISEDSYDPSDQAYFGQHYVDEVVWIWEGHGNFSHQSSFITNELPWGHNYLTVYARDNHGIWSNHGAYSCESCEITLKILSLIHI